MTVGIKRLLAVMVMLVAAAVATDAAIYMQNFDAGLGSWTIEDPDLGPGAEYGTLDWPGAPLGGRSGVLRVTGGAATTALREDAVYDDMGGVNWMAVKPDVKFDFYSSVVAGPKTLDLYFVGAGVMWLNSLTPSAAVGWSHYESMLNYSLPGWYRWDGTPSSGNDFFTSLGDIDDLGVVIGYWDNLGGQVYGLDNFVVVPEPETWCALAVALICLATVFRRELNGSLAGVLAHARLS